MKRDQPAGVESMGKSKQAPTVVPFTLPVNKRAEGRLVDRTREESIGGLVVNVIQHDGRDRLTSVSVARRGRIVIVPDGNGGFVGFHATAVADPCIFIRSGLIPDGRGKYPAEVMRAMAPAWRAKIAEGYVQPPKSGGIARSECVSAAVAAGVAAE